MVSLVWSLYDGKREMSLNTQRAFCDRLCSIHFTNAYHTPNDPTLSSFYQWGNWGIKRLNNWVTVTQVMSGRTGFKPGVHALNHVRGFYVRHSLAILGHISPTISATLAVTTLKYCQTAAPLTSHNLPRHHFPDPTLEMLAPRELLVRISEPVKYFVYHSQIYADRASYSPQGKQSNWVN